MIVRSIKLAWTEEETQNPDVLIMLDLMGCW